MEVRIRGEETAQTRMVLLWPSSVTTVTASWGALIGRESLNLFREERKKKKKIKKNTETTKKKTRRVDLSGVV